MDLETRKSVGMVKDGNQIQMVDIGVNWTDTMFDGEYRGKKKHDADRDLILQRAFENGVSRILCTGTYLSECQQLLKMLQKEKKPIVASSAQDPLDCSTSKTSMLSIAATSKDGVSSTTIMQNASPCLSSIGPGKKPLMYCTVGVHPTRCLEFENYEGGVDKYVDALLALIQEGQGLVVAYGEFGLDYDRLKFCDQSTQLKYFEMQLKLIASKVSLPLFLHLRGEGACKDLVKLLKKYPQAWERGAVVHSFDGSLEDLASLLSLGKKLYIGINGCSLKTEENLKVAAKIPLDRLLVDTDSPWCDIRPTHASYAHVKTHWKSKRADRYKPFDPEAKETFLVKSRNEPCTLIRIVEVISSLHQTPLSEVAQCIHNNSLQLFWPLILKEN